MQRENIYGINTVISLLKVNAGNRKIFEILINKNRKSQARINEIINLANLKKISLRFIENDEFLNLSSLNQASSVSQGVIANVSSYNHPDLKSDIKKIRNNLRQDIKNYNKKVIFAILDGITDEGNFGAILRNCSAFGVDGVIIPKNRSVSVTSRVSRISSGALEEVKVYNVTNLINAIKVLKDNGFWVYGTSLGNKYKLIQADTADYVFPIALVFGSEHKGISRIVEKNCDFLIKIPLLGKMQSLNVAVCTGIMFYIVCTYKK